MSHAIPNASDDPFQILGVTRDADDNTIKKAYRCLAKRWHPDRNPDHPEAVIQFRQVQQAFETIVACREGFPAGSSMSDGDQDVFRADPDPFGGFYWMLKTYLKKKKT